MVKLILFLCLSIYNVESAPTHFIPHTHDDLGWNWTIEEYYNKWVRYIFTTTLNSLERSKSRKFVYSEIGFLKIFLEENHKEKKIQRIKNLIENKQWEFVNGGISQSDSACPYYEDIISNYQYGLWYIKRLFNTTSASGWQLDPFGHSKTLSYIASLFGMKDIVIGRISERHKE